jgi:hypothetical protein
MLLYSNYAVSVIIYLILCTPLIVGGSSNNGSDPVDVSVVITIDVSALRCLSACVCIISRLEEYWLLRLEQLVDLPRQGG